MKQEDGDGIIVPPVANDNGSPSGGAPSGDLDPRIRVVARAIGRQIAREQGAAWEGKNRIPAANDNRPRGGLPEEEGWRPDG